MSCGVCGLQADIELLRDDLHGISFGSRRGSLNDWLIGLRIADGLGP